MRIGEVAKAAGVSKDTVRFYQRRGLISCTWREAGSRVYAEFDAVAVEIITYIKLGQALGFTLAELQPPLYAYVRGALSPEQMRAILEQKYRELEDKQRTLELLMANIRALLAQVDQL